MGELISSLFGCSTNQHLAAASLLVSVLKNSSHHEMSRQLDGSLQLSELRRAMNLQDYRDHRDHFAVSVVFTRVVVGIINMTIELSISNLG